MSYENVLICYCKLLWFSTAFYIFGKVLSFRQDFLFWKGGFHYGKQQAQKDNDLRFCDIHSYRHFHASVLIFSGVDPVSVSADLGHTAVSTTTSIYCHMFQEAQARTSDVIANALDFSKRKTDDRPAV